MMFRLGMVAVMGLLFVAPVRADFFAIDLNDFGFQPTAVNGARQFVGTREFAGEGFRAFRWQSDGGFTNLGTLGGGVSTAAAINEVGWVTGSSRVSLSTTANNAYLWRPGVGMTNVGTLGGTNSAGAALNNAGVVVGSSQTAGNTSTQAFLWRLDTGTIAPLGTLGGNNSSAIGVNNSGMVAGTSDVAGGGTRPFLWTQATGLIDLGGIGGATSAGRAFGINDGGTIIGRSDRGDGTFGAFVWHTGVGFTDLGTFGGANATAFGINSFGQVVGTAQDVAGDDRAFIWDAVNGLQDLNALVTNSNGFTLTSATGISSGGDILAESTTLDGTTIYLVTENPDLSGPTLVPGPPAALLFALGLPILGLMRRRAA